MKTTLKRGIGRERAASGNGNGSGALPPGPLGQVTIYRQPPAPPRTRTSFALRFLGWSGLVLLVLASGVAGGAYLYLHESVAAVSPRSVDVRRAARQLDVPLPGEPATALVIGYDRRASDAKGTPSRSDTLMLLRADPRAQAISLLSFPRDLNVQITCRGKSPFVGKINEAYTFCGAPGTLETVRKLTGVRVNYLITVNFRGFRVLVDKLGGVWMDVDRRYFNDRGGPGGYATIDLQPGYQRLSGSKALDFVRFRHTDSDIYRNARQQLFVRALRDQIRSAFSIARLPQVIHVLTSNVEVAQGGGAPVSAKTVLSYGLLAYSLPPGRVFQSRIEGLQGFADLTTAPENITRAVQQWANPDVQSPRKATAVALGEKLKIRVPPPKDTSVTVLNGNGVTGSASNAGFLLGQRGYQVLTPPNGVPANAPSFGYFRTVIYFDRARAGARQAAQTVANLFGSADVKIATAPIRQLANGAMLTAVVGQTFHGTLAAAPIDQTPKREQASVAPGADQSVALVRQAQRQVGFPLMVPTVIDRTSIVDPERPIRVYRFGDGGNHQTVRLTYRLGSNEYWGVQQTSWMDAPVLGSRNLERTIGGRRYELYFNGPKLHMVVLRTASASYWVVNSLLDRLSNETMLAIAKGLRPLSKVK